jgi:Ca2+-transporting ATPase
MLLLATQLPTLQQALLTSELSPREWLVCAALAAALPVVVELGKLVRRRRREPAEALDPQSAVAPARALTSPRA